MRDKVLSIATINIIHMIKDAEKKHEHVEEKYWKINFKTLSKTS